MTDDRTREVLPEKPESGNTGSEPEKQGIRKRFTRTNLVLMAIVIVVVTATIIALIVPASAVNETELVLECPLEVHRHTEDCYGVREIVDAEGSVTGTERVLICGQADYVVHAHDENCYKEVTRTVEDSEGGRHQITETVLVCALPEIPEHVHDSSCYTETRTLVCGLEENPGHQHTAECWTEGSGENPICGLEEHVHDDGCYTETVTEERELVCGHEEGEVITPEVWSEPVYGDPVVDEETGEVISEGELLEEAHLVSEAEIHYHTEECYTVHETTERELTCGKEEHTHTEECYGSERQLICGHEEGEGAHTHSEECYRVERTLTCGRLELHTHTAECYGTDAGGQVREGDPDYLICGKLQLIAHQHTAECMREVPVESPAGEEEDAETAEETDPDAELNPDAESGAEDSAAAGNGAEEPAAENGAKLTPEADLVVNLDDGNREITYEGSTEHVRVVVTAAADAFPRGTTMVVRDVRDENTIQAVTGAVGEGDLTGIRAVDITFVTPDGQEVQPAKPIKVTMYSDLEPGADESLVVHVDNEGNAEIVEQLEGAKVQETPSGEVSFETGAAGGQGTPESAAATTAQEPAAAQEEPAAAQETPAVVVITEEPEEPAAEQDDAAGEPAGGE